MSCHPQSPLRETLRGGKDNYSVNYAAFVPSLVKAVQELQAANQQLLERLKAVEEQLAKERK